MSLARDEDYITIISRDEFETLALRVGNDPITRRELIQAILDINGLMEGVENLINPKHRRKKWCYITTNMCQSQRLKNS